MSPNIPYRFGLQCTGYTAAVTAIAALSTIPFVGPVAPALIMRPVFSIMPIKWIEAIEPVQGANLLAFCKNVAMGGAKRLSMAGTGLKLRATSPELVGGNMGKEDKANLMELFRKVCRKAEVWIEHGQARQIILSYV